MARPIAKIALVLLGLLAGLSVSAGMVLLYGRTPNLFRSGERHDRETLRAGLRDAEESPYLFDEDLGYRVKPDFSGLRTGGYPNRTNSLGILGDREVDPDPSVRKVLFLGDSVTFGDGPVPLENTFVSRAGRLAGTGYQFLNAGCCGYTTYQELLQHELYLRDADASLLVVCFVPNDLFRVGFTFDAGAGRPVASREFWEIVKDTGKDARIGAIRGRFAARPQTAPLAALEGDFLAAWDPARWEEFERIIPGLIPVDRERTPVVFVAIPARAQVEAALLGAPEATVFYPQARLAEFCGRHRLPLVDARSAFVREGAPAALFLDHCHLTNAGHEALAAYLWPRLACAILPGEGTGPPGERRPRSP